MGRINAVHALLILAFAAPILTGFLKPLTREKLRYSLGVLFDNIEFLAGLLLAVYLTKKVFFEHEGGAFGTVYGWIPEKLTEYLYGRDVLTYILAVPVLLLFLLAILRLVTTPLYRMVLVPLSDRLYTWVSYANSLIRRLMGALWQVPRAVYLPILIALVLNFTTYYFYAPVLTTWMNESAAYKLIYEKALHPVLNSNIAKQIPVIFNDSFRDTFGRAQNNSGGAIAEKIAEKLSGGHIRVIEYFNGVTLDEAVRTTSEIDETAKKVTAKGKTDLEKGYLLYKWISRNIEYDYEKAEKISRDPEGLSSGSIAAFETRKGICFDYSSLYVSMCRAVGLKVRLVTGLGYSGTMWGDHAWNQVYSDEEERWVNLDATFGSSGVNYFDKKDFSVDHKYDEVQGEW